MSQIPCNENYFEKIDTEEKAYWLGFLYADGCISGYKKVVLYLSSRDYEHLECFKKCLQSEHEIKNIHRNNHDYSVLSISRVKMCHDLIEKGCVPAKSTILTFPSFDIVPKELIRHFIRGYFDGDGCLSTVLRKIKNKPSLVMCCEMNFLGTFDFLTGVIENIPLNNIRIIKQGNVYKFRIQNKKDIITILDYLYEDSHIYLKRKHEKYINNVKNYITKRHPLKQASA